MSPQRFFGKYRARVRNNRDPLGLGRLQVDVPAFPGIQSNWALPCLPYAGNKVGLVALPPKGASVWVEFEAGDPSFPIWTGCFWEPGQVPGGRVTPEKAFLITKSHSLVINDTPSAGGLELEIKSPAVQTPIQLKLASDGVTLTTKPAKVHVGTKDVTVELPSSKLVMDSKATTLTVGKNRLTVSGQELVMEASPAKVSVQPGAIKAQLGASQVELTSAMVKVANSGSRVEVASASVQTQSGAAKQQLLTSGLVQIDASGASLMMSSGMVNINKGALEVV